jgi:hypothetical protein
MASLEDEAEDANANAADADAAAAAAERSRVEMGAAADAARAAAEAARAEAEAARADAAEAEARVAAAEARCAEHDQGGGEAPPAIVAAMEASVHRMAELLESLKATVNAECKERYAFFDDRHASRGRSPHARLAAAPWLGARGEANGVGHVQWGLQPSNSRGEAGTPAVVRGTERHRLK